jgi:hypothetical protein
MMNPFLMEVIEKHQRFPAQSKIIQLEVIGRALKYKEKQNKLKNMTNQNPAGLVYPWLTESTH